MIDYIDCIDNFEYLASDRQTERGRAIEAASEIATEALSEVAKRLNDTIVYAFGEFAGWDNHAGYDEIPTDLMIDPSASHRETLAKIWKLREDVNSVLAGMV